MLDTNKTAEEGIEVIVDGRNSWSEIGKTLAKWQELSLGWNSNGTAAHELLHALALYHEHQRDDAFYFIKVNPICRMDGNYQPFNKTDNFGFPYDFDSVMQYPAHIDKQGYYYLITMGRFYQRTIGQDKRLSFKDSAIINHMYCKDYCNGTKNECQNGGYPSPKQCNECLCPEGYAGAHCDQLAQNQNCVDLSGTPNHLEADWQIRELKPKLKCTGAEIQKRVKKRSSNSTNWMKKHSVAPEFAARTMSKSTTVKTNEHAQNISRNWIGAEEADVDIIISARFATTDATELFALTYETVAKLLPSCACTNPHLLFDPERNPGYYCRPPCKTNSTCNTTLSGCTTGFLAQREGSAESFWYYWQQKDIEPMRIEEIHCVACDPEKDKGCKE
ncbi:hypothetical protein niasHT_020847 [Heterodera trifolii]|uniref:Metalloendopeptidase n=1 Tax=Heterodera trifolii TaxID=157864 RepID=A0ABD2KLR3_9BILA